MHTQKEINIHQSGRELESGSKVELLKRSLTRMVDVGALVAVVVLAKNEMVPITNFSTSTRTIVI